MVGKLRTNYHMAVTMTPYQLQGHKLLLKREGDCLRTRDLCLASSERLDASQGIETRSLAKETCVLITTLVVTLCDIKRKLECPVYSSSAVINSIYEPD
jgi:hypothetical protein